MEETGLLFLSSLAEVVRVVVELMMREYLDTLRGFRAWPLGFDSCEYSEQKRFVGRIPKFQ